MAENIEVLNKNIESLNNSLDKLSDKLGTVASSANTTANETTAINSSMVLMNQTISNLGSSVPALTSAFQMYKTAQEQVNVACMAFAANPVGATIQIIATALAIINTIIDKFKEKISESAELTDKWNEATAALEPIMKVANQVLEVVVDTFVELVGVIVKGVEWVGNFADSVSKFFGGSGEAYKNASKEAKQYAKLQADIDRETNERIKERAESDARQGKLREQIAQAEGKAKIKLLNDLKEEIKLQTDAEIALNKKRISLMKYQQSLGATSKAEKEALSKLEAETNKLIGEQANQLAKIEKQIKSTTDSISKDVAEKAKKAKEKALKEVQEYVKERDRILKSSQKESGIDRKYIEETRKLEDARLALENKTASEIAQIRRDRLAEDVYYENKRYEEQKAILEESLKNDKLSEEDRRKFKEEQAELELEHNIEIMRLQVESYKINQDEITNIEKEAIEERKILEEAQREEKKQREEEEKENIERANEAIDAAYNLIGEQFDKLSTPEQKVIDGLLRIGDIWANMPKDAKKAEKAMAVVGSAMQSVTSIVNSYMDAEQERIQQDLDNGTITEEEAKKQFEKTKKVKIAMATISMAQGIAEAVTRAMELGPILGPIIGSINSAAVAAAGIMQIQNIKKSSIEGGGDSSGETGFNPASAGILDFGGTAQPLLNEDFDNALFGGGVQQQQNDMRVYILESDIQESNKRVNVRESSTTF